MTVQEGEKRTIVEEFEVTGNQIVDRVKELFADARAKRLVIRAPNGDEIMTIPLTFGVVAGGILTIADPLLAALGALAALLTRARFEVVREAERLSGQPPAVTGPVDDTSTPSV